MFYGQLLKGLKSHLRKVHTGDNVDMPVSLVANKQQRTVGDEPNNRKTSYCVNTVLSEMMQELWAFFQVNL